MEGEIVDLQVTPEVTMSSGVVRIRRHSTGIVSARNEEKCVPHYLRASIGSCHDICKYGRQEASKAKGKSSIPKRAERKQLRHSSEEIIISVAKHRSSIGFAKPRASFDPKPTKVAVIKRAQSVDSEPLSSDAFDTNEPELPTKSSDSQRQICRNNSSLVKVNPSPLTKFHALSVPKTRRHECSSTFKVETSSKSTSKKEETPLKSNCERAETDSKSASKKMVTSSKKETKFSEKHVISLNPNSSAMQKDFGGRRSCEIKAEKREASSKIASPLRASLSSSKLCVKRIESTNTRKHQGPKIASHPKSQLKPSKDEAKEQKDGVDEKTLYVINSENESQEDIESSLSRSMSPHKFTSSSISQPSSQEDTEESEYATTEVEEDSSSESECLETWEAEKNGKPGSFEDKECHVLKLRMIRRKFGDTENEKRGSPKRLKFRKGKVWWTNAVETGSEKVVLRHHQDVKGKNNGQTLLNSMIEETASKLVETKKSKVLALVGAFETVISLQEHNSLC